jgi:RimJ/RimL family protein N-acetyltransferase
MSFIDILTEIENDKLALKPVTVNDREFVYQLFQDSEISKYYIVPKEAQQDYGKLIDYWLNNSKNGIGVCWIISVKGNDILTKEKQCGFIAFQYKKTRQNATISYAVKPTFRKKGIATHAIEMVILKLREYGILTIEADIDSDNLISQKIVEKLGFTTNKGELLIDPEMLRSREIRVRNLWRKFLVELRTNNLNEKIPLDSTIDQIVPIINQIVEEINSKGKQPELMIRYFYLLGRIRFIEKNYEDARNAFGECNIMLRHENLPYTHIYWYWLGRINKIEGSLERARFCFENALKNYNNNTSDITENDINDEIRSI